VVTKTAAAASLDSAASGDAVAAQRGWQRHLQSREKQRFFKKEQQSTGGDSNRSGIQGATFAASSGKLNHQSTGGDDRCRKALALVMVPAR